MLNAIALETATTSLSNSIPLSASDFKASDSKGFDTRRTRVLSLLSEAYENYSPIAAFEDAESR